MTNRKSIKTRRQQNREQIINDILLIAREMMQKNGVGALSFNAIARELGIKPPSLYTYFDSKNAIYDELFRRGFEQFEQTMYSIPVDSHNLEHIVAIAIRTYMQFAFDNPDLFQLMFERPIPDFVPSEASMAVSWRVLARSREILGTFLRQDTDNPQIAADEADDMLIVIMHGLTALHMANHPELPIGAGRFGKLIEKAASMFVNTYLKPDHDD